MSAVWAFRNSVDRKPDCSSNGARAVAAAAAAASDIRAVADCTLDKALLATVAGAVSAAAAAGAGAGAGAVAASADSGAGAFAAATRLAAMLAASATAGVPAWRGER